MKQFLEAGRIIGTHGVNGNVKVQSWCDSADVLCNLPTLYFDDGKEAVNVLSASKHKGNNVVMRFEGIDSMDKAIAVRGRILYLDRKDLNLSDDTFFVQDIIGCEVLDLNTNKSYGSVTEVFKTGANDVYQVTNTAKKNFLIPVIPDVVKNIDIKNQKIYIVPLENLFD